MTKRHKHSLESLISSTWLLCNFVCLLTTIVLPIIKNTIQYYTSVPDASCLGAMGTNEWPPRSFVKSIVPLIVSQRDANYIVYPALSRFPFIAQVWWFSIYPLYMFHCSSPNSWYQELMYSIVFSIIGRTIDVWLVALVFLNFASLHMLPKMPNAVECFFEVSEVVEDFFWLCSMLFSSNVSFWRVNQLCFFLIWARLVLLQVLFRKAVSFSVFPIPC